MTGILAKNKNAQFARRYRVFKGGGASITVTINNLTNGEARPGDHASLTMSVSEGTITARKWGSTSGGSQYGTGTSPTDYTGGDGGTLYATATVAGSDYTTGAPIRYAAAVNTVAPVASGNTSLGDTLSVTNGTWTGAVGGSYSYQWQRGGVDISGETANTYTIVAADDAASVRCVVSYTNSGGAVAANSNAITVDDFAAPVITGVPTISGTEQVGSVLTATPAAGGVTGNPTPTRTWQWVNSVSGDIGGATNSTYTLQAGDDGDTITVRQIETNGIGATNATSTATGTIAAAPSQSITFDVGTYARPADGNNPSLNNTNIVATGTTGPYYLDLLSVTNGTTPSQADMDAGSGTGVIEKVTLGPQADIADLDGSLDLSAAITNGRIYAQYRDSAGTPTKSDLTSVPVADTINYVAAIPAFLSAEIGNVDDTSLISTMNLAVFDPATTLAASDFDVQVAGSPATESAVSVSGTTIDITLSAAVTNGQTVTVAYNGTALKGVDGEQVATWTAQSVTNNVAASDPVAALYTGGKAGLFYQPTDLSNMWQESSKTTQVSANGQTVGYMNDISGNNHHAHQTYGPSRYIYGTAGGKHWLEADGTNDNFLQTVANVSGFTSTMSCIIGINVDSATLVGFGTSNGGRYALVSASGVGSAHRDGVGTPTIRLNGSPVSWVTRGDVFAGLSTGTNLVITMQGMDLTGMNAAELIRTVAYSGFQFLDGRVFAVGIFEDTDATTLANIEAHVTGLF